MTKQEYDDIRQHKENFIVDEKYQCPVCHKIFSKHGFSTHIFKQHVKADNGIKNSGGNNGHYSDASYRERQRQSSQKFIKSWGLCILRLQAYYGFKSSIVA